MYSSCVRNKFSWPGSRVVFPNCLLYFLIFLLLFQLTAEISHYYNCTIIRPRAFGTKSTKYVLLFNTLIIFFFFLRCNINTRMYNKIWLWFDVMEKKKKTSLLVILNYHNENGLNFTATVKNGYIVVKLVLSNRRPADTCCTTLPVVFMLVYCLRRYVCFGIRWKFEFIPSVVYRTTFYAQNTICF